MLPVIEDKLTSILSKITVPGETNGVLRVATDNKNTLVPMPPTVLSICFLYAKGLYPFLKG